MARALGLLAAVAMVVALAFVIAAAPAMGARRVSSRSTSTAPSTNGTNVTASSLNWLANFPNSSSYSVGQNSFLPYTLDQWKNFYANLNINLCRRSVARAEHVGRTPTTIPVAVSWATGMGLGQGQGAILTQGVPNNGPNITYTSGTNGGRIVVTPVVAGGQGQCASCWAWGTVAMIESWSAIASGSLQAFSEQQMIDCASTTTGAAQTCTLGGLPADVLDYVVAKQGLIATAASYPYNSPAAANTACSSTATYVQSNFRNYGVMETRDEGQMMVLVSKSPVTASLDAYDYGFMFYRTGIYQRQSATQWKLSHQVLVSGYSTTPSGYLVNGLPVTPTLQWDCKNSYGTGWGNNGYFSIVRGTSTAPVNMCGIATLVYYPLQ